MSIQQEFDRLRFVNDTERIRKLLKKRSAVQVSLDVGDTAWNPRDMARPICGPCDVTYTLDGEDVAAISHVGE